jgi:hypothetical protein
MHNAFLAIAIAFVLAAPSTALAQSKLGTEYKPQKPDGSLGSLDRGSGTTSKRVVHKPITITKPTDTASPSLATQNKPLTTTVNPALQGNVLEKSDGAGSPPPQRGYDLKTRKGL